ILPLFYTEIYTFWQFNRAFFNIILSQVINNQIVNLFLRNDYFSLESIDNVILEDVIREARGLYQ
ncbi:hypothetical protein, partial [Flavobacterium sp.]|uniref:hypothetical protein n=1 Tax=Flavobacterium sp. TaxID=239 RepID=UPI0037BE5586